MRLSQSAVTLPPIFGYHHLFLLFGSVISRLAAMMNVSHNCQLAQPRNHPNVDICRMLESVSAAAMKMGAR